jgi:hypothetical protein
MPYLQIIAKRINGHDRPKDGVFQTGNGPQKSKQAPVCALAEFGEQFRPH